MAIDLHSSFEEIKTEVGAWKYGSNFSSCVNDLTTDQRIIVVAFLVKEGFIRDEDWPEDFFAAANPTQFKEGLATMIRAAAHTMRRL